MRRLTLTLALLAAGPGAAAAAPRVQMMVVGRGRPLLSARSLTLKPARVRIGHRTCRVPAGTALAGLLAAHLPVAVTDVAGCDPASMFVRRIEGQRNHGLGGWEYKVGHADPSAGAADPSARLRPEQRLLWYWCVRAGACQRTLDLSFQFHHGVARVTVRGYEDTGRGKLIPGATVHFGTLSLTTNSRGYIDVPSTPGRFLVYATKRAMVQSFPTEVGVTP
jgi:hypothetical protein